MVGERTLSTVSVNNGSQNTMLWLTSNRAAASLKLVKRLIRNEEMEKERATGESTIGRSQTFLLCVLPVSKRSFAYKTLELPTMAHSPVGEMAVLVLRQMDWLLEGWKAVETKECQVLRTARPSHPTKY